MNHDLLRRHRQHHHPGHPSRPSTPLGRQLAEQVEQTRPTHQDLWPAIADELARRHPDRVRRHSWLGQGFRSSLVVALVILVTLSGAALFELLAGRTTTERGGTQVLATPEVVTNGPGDLAVRVGRAPAFPVVAAGSLWVGLQQDGRLLRLDPVTGAVLASLELGQPRLDDISQNALTNPQLLLAASDDALWVAVGSGSGYQLSDWRLLRIERTSNQVVQEVALSVVPHDLVLDGETLWIAAQASPTGAHNRLVQRIDTRTGTTVATVAVPGDGAMHIAADGARVWATIEWTTMSWSDTSALVEIDPVTNTITSTTELPSVHDLVARDGSLWISSMRAGGVMRLDPASKQATTIPVEAPGFLEVADGYVWVTNELRGQVVRIDLLTGETVATYPIEDVSFSVAPTAVWLVSASDDLVVRINRDH